MTQPHQAGTAQEHHSDRRCRADQQGCHHGGGQKIGHAGRRGARQQPHPDGPQDGHRHPRLQGGRQTAAPRQDDRGGQGPPGHEQVSPVLLLIGRQGGGGGQTRPHDQADLHHQVHQLRTPGDQRQIELGAGALGGGVGRCRHGNRRFVDWAAPAGARPLSMTRKPQDKASGGPWRYRLNPSNLKTELRQRQPGCPALHLPGTEGRKCFP
jgi:hypothetical protein